MLKLSEIKKDYKVASAYVHALKGVSLEFRKNEFVCILGQSGCGKTTLLNIIGGLDHYTSGDLVIQDKSTKDFSDRDWDVYRNHRVGFIFQSYNLIPHQSVLANVELALTIAGIGREERKARAQEALRRVGLEKEGGKKPNQLSGGQMQRVAIARALVNNPDILLADEPTGALDSDTSVQIMELIKEIAAERLVIMVTHNPELADLYASRIVRLKDGLVESDSNPYHGEVEKTAAEEERTDIASEEQAKKQKKPKTKKLRARMSFLSSLALSAKNLLTKKGRTIVTSIAGSIGIISVCLVLALSSGFNAYIRRTEEDMLSYYPVQISESSYDMASAMRSFTSPKNMPDSSQIGDKVYVDSFLTGIANDMTVQNDLSDNYLEYIENMDTDWYSAIMYSYGAGLKDNLFTTVKTGNSTVPVEEAVEITMSLSALKTYYMAELIAEKPEYKELLMFAQYFDNFLNKMPGSTDVSDGSFGQYVLSQYDVVEGTFPTQANEAVFVIGSNNEVTDLTLAQLGILPEPIFLGLFEKESGEKQFVDFAEIVGKEYVLLYNDTVYQKTPQGAFPFKYSGNRENLEIEEDEGIEIKISGVLRLKDSLTYGCLTEGLNITEQVVLDYIHKNMESDIVQYVKDENNKTSPASENLVSYYSMGAMDESLVKYLGGSDKVSTVYLYATDFAGKDAMLDYLDKWNDWCENGGSYNGVTLTEKEKITYTDTVGLLMGMMQTMLNVITYVLVAFTAISLVVSSVMIGIITYVSVVERVKEIGVLRSLGARKQDIRNLFNAETFIIGLAAGLFGVVVTYLLSFAVNAIIFSLTGIAGIAALPPLTAFIMVVVSVLLTLISGLIPAQAAAKKDPVIALRTE